MVVLESLCCVVIDSTEINLFDKAINALRCLLDDPSVLGRAICRYVERFGGYLRRGLLI